MTFLAESNRPMEAQHENRDPVSPAKKRCHRNTNYLTLGIPTCHLEAPCFFKFSSPHHQTCEDVYSTFLAPCFLAQACPARAASSPTVLRTAMGSNALTLRTARLHHAASTIIIASTTDFAWNRLATHYTGRLARMRRTKLTDVLRCADTIVSIPLHY